MSEGGREGGKREGGKEEGGSQLWSGCIIRNPSEASEPANNTGRCI